MWICLCGSAYEDIFVQRSAYADICQNYYADYMRRKRPRFVRSTTMCSIVLFCLFSAQLGALRLTEG